MRTEFALFSALLVPFRAAVKTFMCTIVTVQEDGVKTLFFKTGFLCEALAALNSHRATYLGLPVLRLQVCPTIAQDDSFSKGMSEYLHLNHLIPRKDPKY